MRNDSPVSGVKPAIRTCDMHIARSRKRKRTCTILEIAYEARGRRRERGRRRADDIDNRRPALFRSRFLCPGPLVPSERSGQDFRRGVPAGPGRSSRCHRRRRRRRRRRCPGNTHFLLCPRNLEDHFPTLSPRVAALPSGQQHRHYPWSIPSAMVLVDHHHRDHFHQPPPSSPPPPPPL